MNIDMVADWGVTVDSDKVDTNKKKRAEPIKQELIVDR
jgi:hypothetical protein